MDIHSYEAQDIYSFRQLSQAFESLENKVRDFGLEFFLDPELSQLSKKLEPQPVPELRGLTIVRKTNVEADSSKTISGADVLTKIRMANTIGPRWSDAYGDEKTGLRKDCEAFVRSLKTCEGIERKRELAEKAKELTSSHPEHLD